MSTLQSPRDAHPALELSWTPKWLARTSLEETRGTLGDAEGGSARPISFLRPKPGRFADLRRALDPAGDVLRAMPIREIVEAIDKVAARWTDRTWPVRIATSELIVEATGFSPEAVARSLDVELRNYLAPSLWRTLRRELGDPRVLDEARPSADLGGFARAFGPKATLAILTGNVPGLPALAIVRALLVKSPIVVKVASGEPSFASAFARSLHDVDPRLANAIVVTYWSRGESDTLAEAMAPFDTVMAYGGEEVCESVRKLIGPRQRYVEHGHKVSMGIVSRAYLASAGTSRVAAEVARDMGMFNQHACIAPQAYLIEGSEAEVASFAEALADASRAYAAECPLGDLTPRDAAAHQLRRADIAWRAAGDGLPVHYDAHADFTIAVTNDFGGDLSAGNRVLRLVRVASVDEAIARLAPLASYLQNIGFGGTRDELPRAAEALGALGVSRVSQPGRMAEPSMMWKHDGRACVAELVRWCDVEMHESAEHREEES